MKKKLNLLDLNKSSILILIFPYISTNFSHLYNSPLYNLSSSLKLFFIIIAFEIFYKIAFLFKKIKYANSIFLSIIIVLFYGFYIVLIAQNIIGENIRGRFIIPFLFIVIFLFLYLMETKNKLKLLNIYMLIFGTIALAKDFKNLFKEGKNLNTFSNNYINIGRTDKTEKPILLIITDEYSSPIELFSKFKDSSVFKFSRDLEKNNWIVKERLYTYEISTIHSLSSLFNFNLSQKGNYGNYDIYDIGINKLGRAKLYDSLIEKKIRIINYGIFDIGESKPMNRIYFYPNNIFEEFLSNSSVYHIINNTDNLKFEGINSNFFPTEKHNKFVLNNIEDKLSKINFSNFFCYVHLYMPHAPYRFTPYFKGGSINIHNYYDYWKFTNEKLSTLLMNLKKTNKYRIILTGDHGFRNEIKINPHFTFAAFYGFDNESLKKINSVQDLGSLIHNYF